MVNQKFDQSSEEWPRGTENPVKSGILSRWDFKHFIWMSLFFILIIVIKLFFTLFDTRIQISRIENSRPQIGIPANFHSIRIRVFKIVKKNIITMIRNKNNDIQIKSMRSHHERIPGFTGILVSVDQSRLRKGLVSLTLFSQKIASLI